MSENAEKNEEKQSAEPVDPVHNVIERDGTVTINGQVIEYTAHTGTLVLSEEGTSREKESEGNKPKAEIFFVAYIKKGAEDPAQRPITFSFNGGPGSSSVWLHLGLLGPQRVHDNEDGSMPQPPFRLVNNEFSMLDKSDLVFIDPISTGYSRVIEGQVAKPYHGYEKDIASVGDFIRLFTTRFMRWVSPKYLIGESYGTTRAAGLSGYLQERHGMYLNGIMLISSILNFQTARFTPGNDLPYLLFLPSYTAAAWYHNKLAPDLQADLQAALREAEAFALDDYNIALMKGASLSAEERQDIVSRLARLTGLSETYVEQTDLRINAHRYFKQLLRDEGRTIGRLDSRFKGYDRDSAGEGHEYDPLLTQIMGNYTATFNDYVRSELGFESDLNYEILSSRVWPWSYANVENTYLNVAETLRKAMSLNPYLRVYVGSGYFDLGTPYYATDYTLNHLGLHPDMQSNISVHYYEAGHMMYMHTPSLEKQKRDLDAFLDNLTAE
jgi:carboxypeptidase C (cathepsin A)